MKRRFLFSFLAMVWLLLGWGSGPAALAGEISEPSPAENAPAAEPEAEAFLPPQPDVIFAEDLIKKLADDPAKRPLTDEEKTLLPYIVYGEMLVAFNFKPLLADDYKDLTERTLDRPPIPKMFELAAEARRLILRKANLEYAARYGYINRPPLTKEQVPAYEAKAEQGDLTAIFELRRYYENPAREDYNPEKTEARYWLFKAIAAGDEAAMLEAGYPHPYAVRSRLEHGPVKITLDANCEGIIETPAGPSPGCFIYNLIISEEPRQTGHLILDVDYLNGTSLKPRKLALKRVGQQVVVELTSFAEGAPEADVRRDYFNLSGQYLGSDKAGHKPDYFWNYKDRLLSAPPQAFSARNAKTLAETGVRRLPYPEAFLFWEIQIPKEIRSTVIKDLAASDIDEQYLNGLRHADNSVWESAAKKLYLQDQKEEEAYRRIAGFFLMDPYDPAKRLDYYTHDKRTPLVREGLGEYNLLSDLRRYTTIRFDPIGSERGHPTIDLDVLWSSYENLGGFFPYLTYGGNHVEEAKILLACHPATPKSSLAPCYAMQVQYNQDGRILYHYIIRAGLTEPSVGVNIGFLSPTLYRAADKKTAESFIVLYDSYGGTRGGLDRFYLDLFDANFKYLGSGNGVDGSSMVLGYKPLPPHLRDVEDLLWERLEPSPRTLYFTHAPLWPDIIIEKNIISNQNGN